MCSVPSGLCEELNARSEMSYRARACLIFCDLETSTLKWSRPEMGCCATGKKERKTKGPVFLFLWEILMKLVYENFINTLQLSFSLINFNGHLS